MNQTEKELYDRSWMAKARMLAGMTQREVAIAAGLSPGFYNRIENGVQVPNVKDGLKLCKVLGLNPENWLAERRIA